MAQCSTSVWHCTQPVGLCILFQTSAAITLAVAGATQGWFGVLVVISKGVSTFTLPRETECRCRLETGSLSLWQYNQHLWNKCMDGCRDFLLVLGWFPCLGRLNSLLSKAGSYVSLLIDSFMDFGGCSSAFPCHCFASLSLLTFLVASRLLLTLVS